MDKRTRTLSMAHSRIDQVEKDVVEIKTEIKIQFKDLYNRIKRLEAILIVITGASLLLLLRMNFLGQFTRHTHMDPMTILGGLSAGIKAGKQLYALKNQVVDFFDTIDNAKAKHAKKKNSIFAGSDEAGLATYLDAMAARDAEEQLRELIVNTRGLSAYTELQNIRKEIRQERKAAEAQRQIDRQKSIEAFMTIGVIVLSGVAIFGGSYLFAVYMGWLKF